MIVDRIQPAHRVMASFALHSLAAGTLFTRLPEIQKALALSEAAFGMVMLAMPVGVVIGSILFAPLVDSLGPKRLLVYGTPLFGILSIPVALAPTGWLLGAAIFVIGLAFACGNIAMNVEADRIEAAYGTRILNRSHGWWALGFLATTLASAGLIGLGVAPLRSSSAWPCCFCCWCRRSWGRFR